MLPEVANKYFNRRGITFSLRFLKIHKQTTDKKNTQFGICGVTALKTYPFPLTDYSRCAFAIHQNTPVFYNFECAYRIAFLNTRSRNCKRIALVVLEHTHIYIHIQPSSRTTWVPV